MSVLDAGTQKAPTRNDPSMPFKETDETVRKDDHTIDKLKLMLGKFFRHFSPNYIEIK